MARLRIELEWAKLIDFEATVPQAIEEIVRRKSVPGSRPSIVY